MRKAIRAAALVFGLAAAAAGPSTAAMTTTPADQPLRLAPRIQLSQAELQRLQAIASQGADELRRFLWRTRMIYGYRMQDLVG
jgi:hypothetical protein